MCVYNTMTSIRDRLRLLCSTQSRDRPAGKKHFQNNQQLHNCKTELRRRGKSQEQVGNIRKEEYRFFSSISKAEKNTLLEITVTTLAGC